MIIVYGSFSWLFTILLLPIVIKINNIIHLFYIEQCAYDKYEYNKLGKIWKIKTNLLNIT